MYSAKPWSTVPLHMVEMTLKPLDLAKMIQLNSIFGINYIYKTKDK